jgi:hypothetical protein
MVPSLGVWVRLYDERAAAEGTTTPNSGNQPRRRSVDDPTCANAKGRSRTTYASRKIKLGISTALVRQRRPLAGLAAVA